MATLKEQNKINEIYFRTLRNIMYYIDEKKWEHLLNEIGCFRGIIYTMEQLKMPHIDDMSEIWINGKKYSSIWEIQEMLKNGKSNQIK